MPAPLGSLTEGQQYAAEAQHPQGPHVARPTILKSLWIAVAAWVPPPLGSDLYTSRRAVRPLPQASTAAFHPTSLGRRTGNTNPPIVPHHALCVPNGDSRRGPQCTNRNCPGAASNARSVAPSDWSSIASILQSNGSAGPSHPGPPLCLGSFGLCGKPSNKRQLRTHSSFWRGRRGTTSGS